jgi:2-polyprenyl-6-methoxyphenol hydroxylase-like FAD-dependent oxidoreductase
MIVQTKGGEATRCCIAGGGPAGVMLGLLLARRGVPTTILEMHNDFDREFRGDTVHPSTLEILDQLGLAESVHKLPGSKIFGPTLLTTRGPFTPFDLRRLKTKYPYVLMVHQRDLLALLTAEAKQYPGFQLLMGANVMGLIREDGVVRGVRYQRDGNVHELHALLTVAADGRFSRVRHLAGIKQIRTSPPMDVLWFRLPHFTDDVDIPDGAFGGFGRSHIIGGFDRKQYWQVGLVIAKGSYRSLREQGLESLRRLIVEIEPRLAKCVESLQDWRQVSLLSVESSRCRTWYKPGLLLIGDAAHAMSPVGGVGINYAVQDAVVAANQLSESLLNGRISTDALHAVQSNRQWPVRIIQAFQTQIQKRVIAKALESREGQALHIPWFVRACTRIPIIRDLPARMIALGVGRVRVDD